jgi:transposase
MIFTRGLRVCLAVEPADLRRGFEGLALLVRESLQEDERSSQLFVFTNRRRDRVRLLYWDGTGLWLLTKKLEAGTFAWPKIPDGQAKLRLRPEALEMLLSGIDLKGARLRPWYEEPLAVAALSVSATRS